MKKPIKIVIAGLIFGISGLQATEPASAGNDASLMKLIQFAMQERYLIQRATKDYIYAGNNIGTTRAQNDMADALKKFDTKLKVLDSSINDPKIKNLLLFIQSIREDIADTIKEPYSLDNAREVIDLAEAISEGEHSIASKLIKKHKGEHPISKGQRYLVMQVAKYYIAYTSGIKDKNTVKAMNSAVDRLGKLIDEMKKNQKNTPKMNQIVAKIDKDWKIVRKFYLDIEEGDLPFIVYDTTAKMDKKFYQYFQEYFKSKKSNRAK